MNWVSVELRQLRYFLAVAEELHFARAAERLQMTQPPLTVAIRGLERELGVRLFDRSTRKVALTPAGEAFRRRARAALEELDAAAADAAEAAAGRTGLLRVGFVSSASYTVIPEGIREFQRRRPRVELVLSPLTSGEQVELLLDGGLDLGLVRDPGRVPGLDFELLSAEELVAVVPESHPLAAGHEIMPAALRGEPMVLFPYRLMPGFVARVLGLLEPGGVRPNVVQQAIHQETVLGLVAAGIGISVLPASVERFGMPGVAIRPLAGRPMTELHAVRGSTASAAVEEFVDCLRGAVGDPAAVSGGDGEGCTFRTPRALPR